MNEKNCQQLIVAIRFQCEKIMYEKKWIRSLCMRTQLVCNNNWKKIIPN